MVSGTHLKTIQSLKADMKYDLGADKIKSHMILHSKGK